MRTFASVVAFCLLVIAFFAAYSSYGIPQIKPAPPSVVEKLDLAAMTMEQFVALGKRIYEGKGTCTLCHNPLAGYVGGARAPEAALAAPEDLIAETRAEFQDLLGARGEPVLARVRQWPRGLPQYRLGHGRVVAALHDSHARRPAHRPGLFVTGNYLTGCAVGACVAKGLETAAWVHWFWAGDGAMRMPGDGVLAESTRGAAEARRTVEIRPPIWVYDPGSSHPSAICK